MAATASTAAEALKLVPFFAKLNEGEASALAERLIVRRFGPDQIIFHLGDPAGLLYIITHGKVKISYSTPDGQEAVLAILGNGDFFGELALLDDSPRSATAEAIEPTETLTLHRDEFMNYIDNNPAFAHHVLYILARRIRHLNNQISDIFFLDLPGRLARILLHLADQHGRNTDKGVVIDISLTQTDLAEMTGATRVSINKALGRFRRAKWVKIDGRQVTILDRKALQNLIQISGG
ncbi:MAG: Crp/Fnr family transcriptional regulator [Chloroflexi bacterium]|nr:Crp/Fnr family transcriptional regulator [Chloroflexota bacterium]MCI0580941.1 Crp/Fnr family transcriptional regulator [Chloroflexota bacterium]MCI0645029.1 Crp/Fnr family transcriptional regulator [Chloroflexota bacterium]MCI0725604.1 Crp/Fnr family transcriptional regulator [Chloroflexota bacterium]